MTESDDKTRIKFSGSTSTSKSQASPDNTPAVDDNDDKTRIAPRSKDTNVTSANVTNASPEDEKATAARKLAAQKKAKELEKRLAAINAKKNAAAQASRANQAQNTPSTSASPAEPPNPPVDEEQNDDKTRFDFRRVQPAAASESANTENINDVPDDRTRIQQRPVTPTASQNVQNQNLQNPNIQNNAQEDGGDKTRIAPRKNPQSIENTSDDSDKTTFKPLKKPANDQNDIDQNTGGQSNDLSLDEQMPLDAVSSTDETAISQIPVSVPQVNSSGSAEKVYDADGNELLKGRFVFEKVLGAGGMGVVYKAKDLLKVEAQDRDPYVAIKVLGDEFKSHPEAFIALQRESRKTQRIAHPNIVNVHDFDRDGDNVFMTMEYLEGQPLDKLISQYKPSGIPEEEAWKILGGISQALIYAHEQKIIHSDFKPGNIYVTKNGVAKVFDFGIARAVAKAEKFEESLDDKTVFDAGNLGALTPAYASLEMLEGKTPDIRDDIYALGCIAYEMFAGNHPFNRVHADKAKEQKLKPKRLTNVTKRQWRVIEKALAFEREERIPTVDDFWHELTQKRRSPLLVGSIAAVFVAITSLLVYQNFFAPKVDPGVSEGELRTELQREFAIEQDKNDIAELLATLEFTSSWEKRLWDRVTSLKGLIGESDPWLVEQITNIAKAYGDRVKNLVEQEEIERARAIYQNMSRYTSDEAVLAGLLTLIDDKEKAIAQRIADEEAKAKLAKTQQQKKAQQIRQQKERDKGFDTAMATVNKQLLCRSTVNMGDIDIAVNKLRTLNPGRYRKAEGDIVSKLSLCISKIGRSFPERATEFKKRAIRTFPNNKIVAGIKIEPKDPCDKSLAGRGSLGKRATCRDSLKDDGESIGKGPSLVVIPGKGSVKTFAIGKYEVTVHSINKYCTNTGKCEERSNTKFPITNIDMKLVKEYLSWLSEKSKRKYRLPTKAEWVYAARANSSSSDSNRNCFLDSRGIKKGGSLIKATTGKQNDWGLVNAVGNAREFAIDRGKYVVMGGSFTTPMEECVETRSESHEGGGDKFTSFRILREIDAKQKK